MTLIVHRTWLLLATATVVVFLTSIVVIGATPGHASVMTAFQTQSAQPANSEKSTAPEKLTTPEKPDNTALWTALISSIALNLINALSAGFNAWLNMKVKLSQDNMQKSLSVNNRMTAETNMAVRGQQESIEVLKGELADKSNDKRKP